MTTSDDWEPGGEELGEAARGKFCEIEASAGELFIILPVAYYSASTYDPSR